jgi:hypothetical protein
MEFVPELPLTFMNQIVGFKDTTKYSNKLTCFSPYIGTFVNSFLSIYNASTVS